MSFNSTRVKKKKQERKKKDPRVYRVEVHFLFFEHSKNSMCKMSQMLKALAKPLALHTIRCHCVG